MISIISLMDRIGGSNGVDIAGVIGSQAITVLPHGTGLFGTFITAAAAAAAAAGGSLAALGPAATIVLAVWAARKLGTAFFGHHGKCYANEDECRGQEKLWLVAFPDGTVAFRSWNGYLCADATEEDRVIGNRDDAQEWEKWHVESHPDGTISLKSFKGLYMCADYAEDKKVFANRPHAAEWEQWWLEPQPDGFVGLKTRNSNEYLSVAP